VIVVVSVAAAVVAGVLLLNQNGDSKDDAASEGEIAAALADEEQLLVDAGYTVTPARTSNTGLKLDPVAGIRVKGQGVRVLVYEFESAREAQQGSPKGDNFKRIGGAVVGPYVLFGKGGTEVAMTLSG
jgi:hypothetical protein